MTDSIASPVSRRRFLALAAGAGAVSVVGVAAEPAPPGAGVHSLAGTWRFALDREDRGLGAGWASGGLAGHDRIQLPGTLQMQGYGDTITAETQFVAALPRDMAWYRKPEYARYTQPGAVKVPYLSQPIRHYLGVAWYEREIEIPAAWAGQRIELTLERTRWQTTVFLDGAEQGSCRSLVAPHIYDLGQVAAGRHRLSVRIDNRMILPYRPDGHSVSDGEGATWNGIVGRIELRATPLVWIDDAQAYPDLASGTAELRIRIGNRSGRPGRGILHAGGQHAQVEWGAEGGELTLRVRPRSDERWSEFTPMLEELELRLESPAGVHRLPLVYGMREIRAEGKQLKLNGELLSLRFTHDGGGFPLTGYPATSVEAWGSILGVCREWGFNGIRFHSWCPPDAAFVAADRMGMYLQPECGMWNAFDAEGRMLAVLHDETARLLKAFGNHPSLILLNATNEPAGHYNEQLPQWDRAWRKADPRRLYADGTGRPAAPAADGSWAADYLVANRPPWSKAPGRGPSGWFGGDYEADLHALPLPVVGHESGQWCAYPNFDVIRKFTGYMVPGNYEIWRDSAGDNGLLAQNHALAHVSGRFQMACYKEEIEANLRTPSYSGFELLDLHDYLGQGGALVGLLDAFWESKGYAGAEEFRRFNAPTVLLARLRQRTCTTAGRLQATVELAHFGHRPFAQVQAGWKLVDDAGRVHLAGNWASRAVPRGKNIPVGSIDGSLAGLPAPARYRLVVELAGEATAQNEWNLWVYAPEAEQPERGVVVETGDWSQAERALADGRRVLYTPVAAHLAAATPRMSSVPIFWNRLMNPSGAWMLGLICDPAHPALAGFPTEAHCDWQWIEIADAAPAIRLRELSTELGAIVQPIDDWNRNWKLGLVFECRVGEGRLLVSTIVPDAARPGAAALRHSLVRYMQSDRFAPAVGVDAERLRAVFEPAAGQLKPIPRVASSPDLEDPGQVHSKRP